MKPALPILVLCVAAVGCTTPYKSGQTPDDVYFSPAKPEAEYVQVEERDETPRTETREDRYLRLRVRNRDRWSQFDDYYSDPYAYHYSTSNCWCESNPRLSWSYYYSPYSPYYHGYAYVPLRPAVPNRPRNFNFESYRPPAPGAPVYSSGKPGDYGVPSNATGSGSSSGNTRGSGLRNVFSGSTRSTGTQPAGSSPSSSSSSSSSTPAPRNAPVRRF
ncbi:MAG: hypothetical protein EOO12_01140 [Chitinophagaceae bacterium]|nr:MAG: hypothetical protein EOO12_01140 [Chitinophagaceae bacterium]